MKNNKGFTLIRKSYVREQAFTLIELLVVIAIIGILAALALVSFTTSQRQARDTQRKSDLKQYSTALEAYANSASGVYPSYGSVQTLSKSSNQPCTDLGLSNCPYDPVSDSLHIYKLVSNGVTYILWGQLEGSSNFWVVCSSGKNGTISTSSWTGADPTAPACPI